MYATIDATFRPQRWGELLKWDNAALARLQKDVGAEVLTHYARPILEEARAVVPVVTGRLRDSLMIDDSDPNEIFIGSPLDYAEGVETGSHRRAGPANFLRGPLFQVRD